MCFQEIGGGGPVFKKVGAFFVLVRVEERLGALTASDPHETKAVGRRLSSPATIYGGRATNLVFVVNADG